MTSGIQKPSKCKLGIQPNFLNKKPVKSLLEIRMLNFEHKFLDFLFDVIIERHRLETKAKTQMLLIGDFLLPSFAPPSSMRFQSLRLILDAAAYNNLTIADVKFEI